jgi:pimeloyl-ACP methyl ester carboxylesterase
MVSCAVAEAAAERDEGGPGMRVVVDDGVGLEVVVRGTGPTLVLVHGFGGVKEDFADHLDALSTRFRVVLFDHRGHGESDAPEDPAGYTLDRLATDTLAVIEAVGAERVSLLGHSMGGMVVRRVVLGAPERVHALVLMDTSPGPVPGIDGEILELGAEIATNDGMAELKRVMDAFQPLDTPAYQRVLAERPDYKEFNDRKWESLSAVMWATLARAIRDQPDQLADLAALSVPTLVMVGEQDEPFLVPSRRTAATIPGAQLVVIPDAGHSPQFENPAAWRETLVRFLDAQLRESPAA